MAEPLKRTFHGMFPFFHLLPSLESIQVANLGNQGCLTCRKRKVRCRGGDPCQNCSRMNITCHSSFDTNLRIRVSTPTGQKDVETKSKASREQRQHQQKPQSPANNAQPAAHLSFDSGHSGSKPIAATFQHNFIPYSAPQPPSSFGPEPPSIPQLSPLSSGGTTFSDLDPAQFAGLWNFDFPLSHDLEHDFNASLGAATRSPVVLAPIQFDCFRSAQQIPESDASSKKQNQDRTKEWVPRRRKRSGLSAPRIQRPPFSHNPERRSDGTELLDRHRGTAHENGSQDGRWSFDTFALELVQSRASNCPMRLSILAWTTKQSAPAPSSTDPIIAAWYSESSEQVERLMSMPDPTMVLGSVQPVTNVAEIIICASIFLNRYDLLVGNLEAVDGRLERITRWLVSHPGHLGLSSFASKLLLWNCYLQIRIGILGNTATRFSTLLDVLTERADHDQIVEASHSFHLDMFGMFGSPYPQEKFAEDAENVAASLRLHETFCLLSSMLHYRTSRRSHGATAGWHAAIEAGFQRIENEFDLAVATNASAAIIGTGSVTGLFTPAPARGISITSSDSSENGNMTPHSPLSPALPAELSRTNVYWLTTYATFLASKILWSRLAQPGIRTEGSSAAAVESILQIALLLRRSGGHEYQTQVQSSMFWPLPLLVAGIETVDEVRADWLRLFMSDVEAGVPERARKELLSFMEDVRKRQDEVGTRVEVDMVMAGRGRANRMFAF
ncbi:hypothetical protein B0T19DRAFT_191818 [Cercophora scortea]|uniref:Zn(2)-C6 fungal-type domain-containing protein n=1 Tax=Cercophora scortea TaxID=314031 RepID=A0AAE0IP34_9PEZI|nr:hypothetical protein B0T19DRAFT_191818 [Cercophora scortea]